MNQGLSWIDLKEFYANVEKGYLKHMMESLDKLAMISGFVDADHARNEMTRRSFKVTLIFVNNALINVFSKEQMVESEHVCLSWLQLKLRGI